MLQPIVENSIFHEIQESGSTGTIEIEVLEEGNDNSDRIGIKSVNGRIQLHFGTQYSIKVENIRYEGTEIFIIIPINKEHM